LLPNWAHDALLESTSSKSYEESSSQVSKGSGNPNSTASTFNPSAKQIETLTVESPIPTASSPVPTACLNDSSETSSAARLVSKRVVHQKESPSLDNILSRSKDKTSDIIKKFITKIENLKDLKVKIIRCNNGGEFRNKKMNDFCSQKGIKREFSNARTPQQNGVAERRNRTLIEAAKIMLAMPVDAGTNSTNLSGTKDAANQEVKKDVSSLRYIVLPNWAHDALLESSSSKSHDESSSQVPKGSRNLNPTVSSSNAPADQMETLTVESPIPTVSLPVPTACLNDSPKPSSEARLISKRVVNHKETPSLDNILSLTNS
nr:putative ribonuclease H-like domain-containing protein [Tanacetum cinerariifolium]